MAHCGTKYNHLDSVMVVDDGIIIINDVTANIKEENVTEHQEVLSLPLLHEMNVKNLRYIGELQTQTKMRPIVASCVTFACLVVCYVFISLAQRWLKKRRQAEIKAAIELNLKKTEDGLHLSEGGVNIS